MALKPKAPKKKDTKPSAKSGEVREKDGGFYNLSFLLGDNVICDLDLSIENNRNTGFTRTILIKGDKNINNLFD